jgi:integrase
MRGNITRRGKSSWRIKFEKAPEPDGRRRYHVETVHGTKKAADAVLTERLGSVDKGTFVEANKTTVAAYLDHWLDNVAALAVTPKTLERYHGLAAKQIKPHLGASLVQRLKPVQIQEWHAKLLRTGRHDGGALSARSVTHAHRVLSKALNDAVKAEIVPRNVASVVSPPKGEEVELEILSAAQVADVMVRLRDVALYPIVVIALATGLRRGEILALQWGDVDFEAGRLRVERSLEQTKGGVIRVKPPKTKRGRRNVSLPADAIALLRRHRASQLEQRLALGMGKLPDDAWVFGRFDGATRSPRAVSEEWTRNVDSLKLPKVTFHALRHTHASALIAANVDVLTISRRLGHGSAAITLKVYGHLFSNTDDKAAAIINTVLGAASE